MGDTKPCGHPEGQLCMCDIGGRKWHGHDCDCMTCVPHRVPRECSCMECRRAASHNPRPAPRAYSTPRDGLEDAINEVDKAIDVRGFAFRGVDLRHALRTIRACLIGTREAMAKHETESGALRREIEEWPASLPPAPICTDDACKCVACIDYKAHAFKRSIA